MTTLFINKKMHTRLYSYDLDDSNLPKDPRQVKSYVDLDAPAEGDADISFY